MAELYRITNNTDLRDAPLENSRERAARKAWKEIKPGPRAGNLYSASFLTRCQQCGGWQEVEAERVTCQCDA